MTNQRITTNIINKRCNIPGMRNCISFFCLILTMSGPLPSGWEARQAPNGQ